MRKQLFGYTPAQREGDAYVPFIAVVERDADTIVFCVRSPDGGINEIALPRAIAAELGAALAVSSSYSITHER